MTQTLMGIVALDDAFCIITVGLAASIVTAIETTGGFEVGLLINPVLEMLGSLALGVVTGFIFARLFAVIKDREQVLVLMLGLILLNSGLASIWELSPLLVNMVSGFTITNLLYHADKVFQITESVEQPIFVVFFTLAGSGLHIRTLIEGWLMGTLYILSRIVGKLGGIYTGAVLAGAEEKVKKWLGLAMLPKAGVSIGMVFFLADRFPQLASIMLAIELAAVTFFEIIGPIASKVAIFGAGEVPQDNEETASL